MRMRFHETCFFILCISCMFVNDTGVVTWTRFHDIHIKLKHEGQKLCKMFQMKIVNGIHEISPFYEWHYE